MPIYGYLKFLELIYATYFNDLLTSFKGNLVNKIGSSFEFFWYFFCQLADSRWLRNDICF
ncbi:hypothetical protein SHINM13_18040 [Flavobacterium ammonificans]|nr:hypothetical protein SHINM13_18040 [Flavobacterium ammonificans]